jgi:uncharacterized protein YbcI
MPVAPLGGEVLAEVSNAVVRLLHDHYGRGPTKAKTYAADQYLLTVLEDTLTTAERTLVAAGRQDLVREARITFSEALSEEFRLAVARATGRSVIAYHTQLTFDPERLFMVFVLAPGD